MLKFQDNFLHSLTYLYLKQIQKVIWNNPYQLNNINELNITKLIGSQDLWLKILIMISMIFHNILFNFLPYFLYIYKYFLQVHMLHNSMSPILQLILNILKLFQIRLIQNVVLLLNLHNIGIISYYFHVLTSHTLLVSCSIQSPMMFLLFINN